MHGRVVLWKVACVCDRRVCVAEEACMHDRET